MEKVRIVKSKALANALVWIGFSYTLDEEGQFIFERTREFDNAFRDLHSVRNYYTKKPIIRQENVMR